MPEIEYGGIKVKGGKLLLILPLLGTLGGAIWGGFEGYARWVAMETNLFLISIKKYQYSKNL